MAGSATQTHVLILADLTAEDPQWGLAVGAWFTTGTIAAVVTATGKSAGESKHLLVSGMRRYNQLTQIAFQ